MPARFRDRCEAGRTLALKMMRYKDLPHTIVLALPRGGVPVAYEVARVLNVPMDIFVVRKLGVPGHEELAMGAIASGGTKVLNEDVIEQLRIPAEVIDAVAEREQRELERRELAYRDHLPTYAYQDQTIILVDDGLATGATMRAAIDALRLHHPAKIVVAVPTAAPQVCLEFRQLADDVICGIMPDPFYAVGMWYEDFSQTSDDEVRHLLTRAHRDMSA